jgi:hypothetical protein
MVVTASTQQGMIPKRLLQCIMLRGTCQQLISVFEATTTAMTSGTGEPKLDLAGFAQACDHFGWNTVEGALGKLLAQIVSSGRFTIAIELLKELKVRPAKFKCTGFDYRRLLGIETLPTQQSPPNVPHTQEAAHAKGANGSAAKKTTASASAYTANADEAAGFLQGFLNPALAPIRSFLRVRDSIQLCSVNRRSNTKALRHDGFFSELFEQVWPAGPVKQQDLRGVVLRKPWVPLKADGYWKRMFILSHLADIACGQEQYPVTMGVVLKSTTLTVAKVEAAFSGEEEKQGGVDEETYLLGSTAARTNFEYITKNSSAGAVGSQLPYKLQVFRAGQIPVEDTGFVGKGFAVRALEPIEAGSFVCEYTGDYIQDFDQSSVEHYAVQIGEAGDVTAINAACKGNVSRFINSSNKTSNLEQEVQVCSGGNRVVFHAKRDIGAGEELLWDYKSEELQADKSLPPSSVPEFWCGVCRKDYKTATGLDEHKKGKKHKKRARGKSQGVVRKAMAPGTAVPVRKSASAICAVDEEDEDELESVGSAIPVTTVARKSINGKAPRRQMATVAAWKAAPVGAIPVWKAAPVGAIPVTTIARKSTNGKAPRRQMATEAARKAAPVSASGVGTAMPVRLATVRSVQKAVRATSQREGVEFMMVQNTNEAGTVHKFMLRSNFNDEEDQVRVSVYKDGEVVDVSEEDTMGRTVDNVHTFSQSVTPWDEKSFVNWFEGNGMEDTTNHKAIRKVLKLGGSSADVPQSSLRTIDDLLKLGLKRLVDHASSAKPGTSDRLTVIEVCDALDATWGKSIAEHAKTEGAKAAQKLLRAERSHLGNIDTALNIDGADDNAVPSIGTGSARNFSAAGLYFDVQPMHKRVAPLLLAGDTDVYLTGIMEYLCAEIMELSSNECQRLKKSVISVQHVVSALEADEELALLFKLVDPQKEAQRVQLFSNVLTSAVSSITHLGESTGWVNELVSASALRPLVGCIVHGGTAEQLIGILNAVLSQILPEAAKLDDVLAKRGRVPTGLFDADQLLQACDKFGWNVLLPVLTKVVSALLATKLMRSDEQVGSAVRFVESLTSTRLTNEVPAEVRTSLVGSLCSSRWGRFATGTFPAAKLLQCIIKLGTPAQFITVLEALNKALSRVKPLPPGLVDGAILAQACNHFGWDVLTPVLGRVIGIAVESDISTAAELVATLSSASRLQQSTVSAEGCSSFADILCSGAGWSQHANNKVFVLRMLKLVLGLQRAASSTDKLTRSVVGSMQSVHQ